MVAFPEHDSATLAVPKGTRISDFGFPREVLYIGSDAKQRMPRVVAAWLSEI